MKNFISARKTLGSWFVIIGVLAISTFSRAEEHITTDPITGSQIIRGVAAPKIVYHWTTFQALARIAGDKSFSDRWDMFSKRPRNSRPTGFFSLWPQFEEPHGGLFTWTHPILGMKGGEFEDYGDVVIQIEIDTAIARAARVKAGYNHSDGQPRFQSPIDVSDIDLVDDGNEIILLNPRIIKNLTANIDTLRPIIELELQRLKDPSYKYNPKDIHFADFKAGGYRDDAYLSHAIHVLERWLSTDPTAIPSWFRRESDGRASTDRWITGYEALGVTIPKEFARRYEILKKRMHLNYLKNVRDALAKVDPTAECDVRCLNQELEWHIAVYVEDHPEAGHLVDLQKKLSTVIFRNHNRLWNFGAQDVAPRMREAPFNPHRAIIDLKSLVEFERFDSEVTVFADAMKNAPDVEKFEYEYEVGRKGIYDERFRFLQNYKYRSPKQRPCAKILSSRNGT